MSALLLGVALLSAAIDTTSKPTSLAQRPPDRWLAEDKAKHFAMSYAVTTFAFGGASAFLSADESLVAAAATGLAAGVLKELYDKRRGEAFSVRDLIWDVAGVAVGVITVKRTF